MRRAWVMRLAALIVGWSALAPCAAAAAVQPEPQVLHYEVQLQPDVAQGRVQGTSVITVRGSGPLRLDVGALRIAEVRNAAGEALPVERQGTALTVTLPGSADTRHRLSLHFGGQPAKGVTFVPQAQQVFTAFSTSAWMPCQDAPDRRATLALSLRLPAAWQVAASGRLLRRTVEGVDASNSESEGMATTEWQLDAPTPCYLFGFAAGALREVVDDSAEPRLRLLAPPEFSEDALRRIFADTRSMIAFYESRAGVAYPAAEYTQVLVSAPAAQELAGLAVMGRNFGQRVLADPQATWLAAHELSHQWWGNAVTNAAWTEFWLNEGIASFMNAAWFEHRHGAAAYRLHLDAARRSWHRVRDAGHDKPLIFDAWSAPTADDRALVYDKGALFVQLLRERMGDEAFWRGMRVYTRAHWGRSVRSADFQAAMQSVAELDLAPLFAEWVGLDARAAPSPPSPRPSPAPRERESAQLQPSGSLAHAVGEGGG